MTGYLIFLYQDVIHMSKKTKKEKTKPNFPDKKCRYA